MHQANAARDNNSGSFVYVRPNHCFMPYWKLALSLKKMSKNYFSFIWYMCLSLIDPPI